MLDFRCKVYLPTFNAYCGCIEFRLAKGDTKPEAPNMNEKDLQPYKCAKCKSIMHPTTQHNDDKPDFDELEKAIDEILKPEASGWEKECACEEPHISDKIIHTKERCYLRPNEPWEVEFYKLTKGMDGQYRPRIKAFIATQIEKEKERGRNERPTT